MLGVEEGCTRGPTFISHAPFRFLLFLLSTPKPSPTLSTSYTPSHLGQLNMTTVNSTQDPTPGLPNSLTLTSTEEINSTPTPPSPSHTAVDLEHQHQKYTSGHNLHKAERKWERAEEAPTRLIAENAAKEEGPAGAEIKLSQGRKWFLLFIFSVAQYLDIASYSGLVSRYSRDGSTRAGWLMVVRFH